MRGVIPYTRYVIHTYTALVVRPLHTRGARGELLAALALAALPVHCTGGLPTGNGNAGALRALQPLKALRGLCGTMSSIQCLYLILHCCGGGGSRCAHFTQGSGSGSGSKLVNFSCRAVAATASYRSYRLCYQFHQFISAGKWQCVVHWGWG